MAYNTAATFYPGGEDSYYMPEVVAPAPQRLAERPANIEQNVAYMEHVASTAPPRFPAQSLQTGGPSTPSNGAPWSPISPSSHQYTHQNMDSKVSVNSQPYQQPYQNQSAPMSLAEQPRFSPFPKVKNRGMHVPPTDEEKEVILESAREAVLASDDFETQLTWAQDALTHVEICANNERLISQTQPARPRTPRVEHMLREDAMKVVEFLADQHHPRAEFTRGLWLEFGKFGLPVDKREAFNCYSRAAERGYARAYYRMGMQFESSNDALEAIRYYKYGVDNNDAASCYRLGMMTLLGQHGQAQDFQKALQLIHIASDGADENAPQGAYVLGMLQCGELTQVSIAEHFQPKDMSSARINVERAAFLGFAKAQVRMGSAYELGDLGCHFDPALSLHYNALAARQGEPEAEMAISKWFLCGHEDVFAKSDETAFTYAQRAAISGLGTAQFAMGYFYEVGIYVKVDLKQAKEWYQKADENGNSDAGKRIRDISRSKTISRKDHESVAVQRIRQQHAANNGNGSLSSVQESTAAMPTQTSYIAPLDMPDPARLSLNSSPSPGLQRPTSTAPYPPDVYSMPQQGPGNFRPTSAFGINPNLRSNSAMSSPRPDSYRGSSPPASQQRPYSVMPNGQPDPGYGRGGRQSVAGSAYSYNGQPPFQQRQNSASPYSGPNEYPSQRPPPQNSSPLPSPKPLVDIGFSAPIDPTGPDGQRKRRPRPSQQQQQKQQQRPPPKDPGYQASSKQDNIQAPRIEPSRPPRSSATTPNPNQQKPSTVSASAAPSKLPGKGPKTFDEMGIAQAKKESDCIVM